MRYSITTGAAGDVGPRELADLAALAEDHGWDAFFLEDYIVYQGRSHIGTYDPWVCLAAMAMTTTSIRLGTTVTPVSRRRPWKLAAEAVSLDHLSRGRVILGVGSGDVTAPDYQATGEPVEERVGRLDEGLAIIAGLWSGGPVDFHGEHFDLRGLQAAATPVQAPRIPIWVGGDIDKKGVRRRIARWDGSCAYKTGARITPDDVRGIRDEVAATGDFDVKVSGTDDLDEIAALEAAGATWWGQWVPPDKDVVGARIRQGPPRAR